MRHLFSRQTSAITPPSIFRPSHSNKVWFFRFCILFVWFSSSALLAGRLDTKVVAQSQDCRTYVCLFVPHTVSAKAAWAGWAGCSWGWVRVATALRRGPFTTILLMTVTGYDWQWQHFLWDPPAPLSLHCSWWVDGLGEFCNNNKQQGQRLLRFQPRVVIAYLRTSDLTVQAIYTCLFFFQKINGRRAIIFSTACGAIHHSSALITDADALHRPKGRTRAGMHIKRKLPLVKWSLTHFDSFNAKA